MKMTPIVLATVLVASGGAWAQARDGSQVPGERAAADAAADGRTFGEKVRGAADKVGDATRRTFNKARGETRQMSNEAKDGDRQAGIKADKRPGARQASRKDQRDDTRAMGASGERMDADADSNRRERMDQAYAHWKAQQQNR